MNKFVNMEENFRRYMQQLANRQATSPKSTTLTKEKYNAIRNHLLNPSIKIDAHFKHWIKMRQFQLIDFPDLSLHQVLVIPNNRKNAVDASSTFLEVVHAGNLFDTVHEIHSEDLNHSGYKKVIHYVHRHYYGITRGFVQEFCKYCPICKRNMPRLKSSFPPPMATPKGMLQRVQVDIIDMRHSPDGHFNHIGHFMDHFSKFHVLFPLRENSTKEVSMMLEERVLAYFGPPRNFHSDNGEDFVNQLIVAMSKRWEGEATFLNGQPEHSLSQSVVQKANQIVEEEIATMKQDLNLGENVKYPWASWLPRIMFSMNCSVHADDKNSPYHTLFGKSLSARLFSGAEEHYEDDEASENAKSFPANAPPNTEPFGETDTFANSSPPTQSSTYSDSFGPENILNNLTNEEEVPAESSDRSASSDAGDNTDKRIETYIKPIVASQSITYNNANDFLTNRRKTYLSPIRKRAVNSLNFEETKSKKRR